MTKREEIEKTAEELLNPILQDHDFELVDLEYVKEAGTMYLRAYIDKRGGITIDDCEVVSRAFSDLLDEKDFIPDSYIMEISSPGLGRPLKKDKDFERSIGEAVEIKLFRAEDHQKEFSGILQSYDKTSITVAVVENITRSFARDNIALVRLALDF